MIRSPYDGLVLRCFGCNQLYRIAPNLPITSPDCATCRRQLDVTKARPPPALPYCTKCKKETEWRGFDSTAPDHSGDFAAGHGAYAIGGNPQRVWACRVCGKLSPALRDGPPITNGSVASQEVEVVGSWADDVNGVSMTFHDNGLMDGAWRTDFRPYTARGMQTSETLELRGGYSVDGAIVAMFVDISGGGARASDFDEMTLEQDSLKGDYGYHMGKWVLNRLRPLAEHHAGG